MSLDGPRVNPRREAERLLANAARHITEDKRDMRIAEVSALVGNGYATLAAAAARPAPRPTDAIAHEAANAAYRSILVGHIAHLLEHGTEEQHNSAADLAKRLDGAGLNVDADVDERIDRYGEISSADAWKPPSVRRAEWDAAIGEPPF